MPCEAEKEGLGVRYHCLVSCSDRCRWHFAKRFAGKWRERASGDVFLVGLGRC